MKNIIIAIVLTSSIYSVHTMDPDIADKQIYQCVNRIESLLQTLQIEIAPSVHKTIESIGANILQYISYVTDPNISKPIYYNYVSIIRKKLELLKRLENDSVNQLLYTQIYTDIIYNVMNILELLRDNSCGIFKTSNIRLQCYE